VGYRIAVLGFENSKTPELMGSVYFLSFMILQVLTAAIIMMAVVWDLAPCGLVEID
jgi:hypothetical protein